MIAQPLPKETREKARQLFLSGLRPYEVANQLGLSDSTVRSWYAKHKRDVAKAEETLAISTLTEVEPEYDEEMSLPEQQERYLQNLRKASLVVSEHAAKLAAPDLIRQADKLNKIDAVGRRVLELEKPLQVIQIAVLAQPPPPRKLPPIEAEVSEAGEARSLVTHRN